MKYCPVCQTRYGEEIIKFCTKDGAPLVEENPTFTAMPSESLSAEDFDGEETIIRRNPPSEKSENSSQRIVIPTNEVEREAVRAKAQPPYQPPPKSNTAVTVLLTLIGTLVVLGGLGGVWYLLRGGNATDANANKNTNINTASNIANFNTNIDTNIAPISIPVNTNVNANSNSNVNTNANVKTPTPTRTPTPTPTATPENSNSNASQNSNMNLGNTNVMSRPTATPTVTPSPKPTQNSPSTPSNVNVGVMNSRAVSLTTPAYPQSARQVNAGGEVRVQISVDEAGNVISAKAISGHPLLRPSAEAAARQSRFNPVKVGDHPVSASGVLVYNFINQ